MIYSLKEYKKFIIEDAKANKRTRIRPSFLGDEIWKFLITMRKLDFYTNQKRKTGLLKRIKFLLCKYRYHTLSVKLGFSIGNFDKIGYGFSIAHFGNVVINSNVIIGNYCRIHEGVCIGATNGEVEAPILSDYIFVGTGAKIIGNIKIEQGVCIGANAVVVKSINEPNTTWGGVPAKLISHNDSSKNLAKTIFTE